MKELKNMFKLSHKVSIYVPSVQQDGTKVYGRLKKVNEVKAELAEMFGGCTSTKAVGSWILQSGNMQSESVELCTSYAEKITPENIDTVIGIGERLKEEMNQEAISVELDGELYFL